jgi:SAM-dependent methyltransferase
MYLAELQRRWDEVGRLNPFSAILAGDKNWELDQFFLSGDMEIARVIRDVESLGLRIRPQRALDFGCGVGRLTQALCTRFFRCDGVDIAPSMIAEAQKINRFGERCHYHVNAEDNLALFAENSFDFVYSNIVLQHIEPPHSTNYIRDFLRILAPGGIAVIQLPSERAPLGEGDLPKEAYQASIRCKKWWIYSAAGTAFTIHATVRNMSRFTWPSRMDDPDHPPVMLGNHWLGRDGHVVCHDDGRAPLPHDLKPGEEVALVLRVQSPSLPGSYVVELDMVQAGVTWFKLKGSKSTRIRARVTGQRRPQAPPPDSAAPPIALDPVAAMHPICKDEVIAIINGAGGKLVDIAKDGSAGPEWRSFRYCFIKP